MNVGTLYSSAARTTALDNIGGNSFDSTIPGLLQQAIVAVGNNGGGGGGGSTAWGSITGTLSNQADLQSALNLKATLGANTFTALQQFTGTTHAGLRLNNLTTAERDAIASPQAGMAIWNTTAARLQLHNGSAWTAGMVRLDGDTMTGALTIGVGTLATTGLRLTQTWNGGAGTTHRGMDVAVTATAGQFAAASTLFRVLGGTAGATDRMVLTEEKLAITGTEATNRVLDLTSPAGTAYFSVTGGGTLFFSNGAHALPSNGELRGAAVGNSSNFLGVLYDTGSSLACIRPSTTTLQVGVGAASPTAYTLRGASSRAGTDTNVAGASLTIAGGNGTGTGGGGSLIFQTAPTGSTGSTANTLTTRMTIDNAGAIAFPNTTAVTTETVVSDRTWPVTINGVAYKVCLKV